MKYYDVYLVTEIYGRDELIYDLKFSAWKHKTALEFCDNQKNINSYLYRKFYEIQEHSDEN